MSQTTEQRLSGLEETVQNLKTEIQAYKDLFAMAAKNPTAKQVLRMLGVDPGRLKGSGR